MTQVTGIMEKFSIEVQEDVPVRSNQHQQQQQATVIDGSVGAGSRKSLRQRRDEVRALIMKSEDYDSGVSRLERGDGDALGLVRKRRRVYMKVQRCCCVSHTRC